MKTLFQTFGMVVFVGLLAIFFRPYLQTTVSQMYQRLAPCSQPITYKIGTIDPRFGVATSTFLTDIDTAASIWDDVHDKTLFAYDQDNGVVTINFVYDKRQEVSQQLNNLDATIQNSKSQYDALKAQYESEVDVLNQKKTAFESEVSSLKTREVAYQEEVQSWNARGGAPKSVYAQLQAEHASLVAAESQLKVDQAAVNTQVDAVNTINDQLNVVITVLNGDATSFNTTNQAQGNFEEGIYSTESGKQEIDIYEYSDQVKLLRVLAHELGHAIGLEHVSDPQAIMYAQNSGTGLAATAADITALDAICHT